MVTIDYIKKAWNAYKNNFWYIFAALLFQIIITFIPVLIGIAPWIAVFFFSGETLSITNIVDLIFSNLGLLLFSFVMLIISILLSIALAGGFVRMMYEALRGKAKFETMLTTAKQKFWTIIGANLLAVILIFLIFIVLMSPSIILFFFFLSNGLSIVFIVNFFLSLIIVILFGIFFVFVNQAIVIDNLTAVKSIEKSFEVSKRNFLNLIFMILIFFVINLIVQRIPFVGYIITLFLTGPLALLSYTAIYIEKRKKH